VGAGESDEQIWLDIVLPCLDEAGALPAVLSGLPAGSRAIVADNGSTDASAEVARGLGATVVAAAPRGYGSACAAGLDAATAPVVAFADCDATVDLADVAALAVAVRDGATDLVTTRRRVVGGVDIEPGVGGVDIEPGVGGVDIEPGVGGVDSPGRSRSAGWPPHARAGAWVVARLLGARAGVLLTDVGPVRIARTEALRSLGVVDRRSGYPVETVLRAARAGWRITEAELPYRPRVGRSKVTGTLAGTLRAIRDMSAVLAR